MLGRSFLESKSKRSRDVAYPLAVFLLTSMSKHKGTGRFGKIKFCPECGVESLKRDFYRTDHKGERSSDGLTRDDGPPEYVCSICGFAFRISPSLRYRHAEIYFKEHRQMRPVEGEV